MGERGGRRIAAGVLGEKKKSLMWREKEKTFTNECA